MFGSVVDVAVGINVVLREADVALRIQQVHYGKRCR